MKTGKHMRAMLDFSRKYPGPHSLTARRSDPSHAAIRRLTRQGRLVTLTIGSTVMFELPEGAEKQ